MELKKRQESRYWGLSGGCPHLEPQPLKLLIFGLPRAPGPFPAVRESEGLRNLEYQRPRNLQRESFLVAFVRYLSP